MAPKARNAPGGLHVHLGGFVSGDAVETASQVRDSADLIPIVFMGGVNEV